MSKTAINSPEPHPGTRENLQTLLRRRIRNMLQVERDTAGEMFQKTIEAVDRAWSDPRQIESANHE